MNQRGDVEQGEFIRSSVHCDDMCVEELYVAFGVPKENIADLPIDKWWIDVGP